MIKVTVKYSDSETITENFRNLKTARAFASDECAWENTTEAVVESEAGKFLMKGDYVDFCDNNK